MDHRDAAVHMSEWIESFDEKNMLVIPAWSEDGAAIDVKYVLCPTCEGKGKYVNPSIDSHGISPEEFAEDPGFYEDYRRGVYDVVCARCKGRRVIVVPSNPDDYLQLKEWDRDTYNYLAAIESERKFGA